MSAPDANEVKLWSVDLAGSAAELARLERGLSDAERDRAAKFLFPDDRRRFIVAHAALRAVLGAGLGTAPEALVFATGAHGKPALADPAHRWLRFNLSHSGERALIGCARERELGVDLEAMRENVACADIVARFFSPEERREWESLPEEWRRPGFFHGWARKEAYVKALGEGLSHAPEAYTVALDPREPGRLLRDGLLPGAEQRWSVRGVPAPAGYAAAVAYAGNAADVTIRLPIELGFGLEPAARPRPEFTGSHVANPG